MKTMLKFLCLLVSFTALLSVASCTAPAMRTHTTADTDECRTMVEVCKDAQEFQREYDRLPEEEKDDMAAVLNTYTEHCTNAVKECDQSKKRLKKK
ncbi:MAG: hypothetical protein ACOC41_06815 [Chitinivibrionales bacterium]